MLFRALGCMTEMQYAVVYQREVVITGSGDTLSPVDAGYSK